MHTDRIGNGADTAPRAMAMATLLVLLAGLTVWLGLGTLREVLTRWDLGALAHRDQELEVFRGDGPPVWRGKLVVLVDRTTIGAAEVLASVLRQKAAAELVGDRTFGHAGRTARVDLPGGGRLFTTDAFYSGPDREPLDDGLAPDVKVDGASRSFAEPSPPVGDLILQRGIELLLDGSSVQLRGAA